MRELLLEYLNGWVVESLTFERANYKGSEGYEVVVRVKDDNRPHYFWFAKINRMGAEHMAAVIKSYLMKEAV